MRNYRKEYDLYYGKKGAPQSWTRKQRLHRKHKTSRNKARKMIKDKFGKIRKFHDINHKDGNPLNNDPKNLSVIHRTKNRKK
tara:strand:- start:799 stop:1044 length:246 start_codon:yes stop_codon:yes gene_type:complete